MSQALDQIIIGASEHERSPQQHVLRCQLDVQILPGIGGVKLETGVIPMSGTDRVDASKRYSFRSYSSADSVESSSPSTYTYHLKLSPSLSRAESLVVQTWRSRLASDKPFESTRICIRPR